MPRAKGQKKWEPSADDIKRMESMAGVGISQEQIAKVYGVSVDTLQDRFGELIANARTKAVASIGGALYRKAMAGNVTAMIFYLKTQGGWRETNSLELTGKDGEQFKPIINITIKKPE